MHIARFGIGNTAVLLALVGFAGCAGGPAPEASGNKHMYVHYTQVGEILSAVVAGDVGATRNGARWLSTHQGDEFPAAGQQALEMMRVEGRIILAQNQISEIAMSVARMGVACATCHTAVKGGPSISVDMAPPATSDPGGTMVRHEWASDRLWEGIVGPSDAAWASGAAVMGAPALDLGLPGSRHAVADELAKRVPELGQAAKVARTQQERAEVYGQLLQTCTRCHAALGMKMR